MQLIMGIRIMQRQSLKICAVILLAQNAYAGGNGTTPNGQPFVEIQGQFVEVIEEIDDMQAHIDSLVGRVDSLEDRVTANEDAITGLEAKNLIYEQQISDLVSTAAANNADIQSALDQITSLEDELSLLNTDAALNAEAIAENEAEIGILRDFISENTEGLQTLETKISNNLASIDALNVRVSEIQDELAGKQDILNGSCAPGTALTAIDPDGTVTCQTTGTGFTKFTVTTLQIIPGGTPSRWRVCHGWPLNYCHYHYGPVNPVYGTAVATCPVGSILTGGSYVRYSSYVSILSSNSTETVDHPANSWVVTGRNSSTSSHAIVARAECIRFD